MNGWHTGTLFVLRYTGDSTYGVFGPFTSGHEAERFIKAARRDAPHYQWKVVFFHPVEKVEPSNGGYRVDERFIPE